MTNLQSPLFIDTPSVLIVLALTKPAAQNWAMFSDIKDLCGEVKELLRELRGEIEICAAK